MKIKLSIGEVLLKIWFGPPDEKRRTTHLRLTLPSSGYTGPVDIGVTARCSEKDQFERRLGKREAVKRLMDLIFNGEATFLDKADRRAIWQAVFPRFAKRQNELKGVS
jgi:hypothetical protein